MVLQATPSMNGSQQETKMHFSQFKCIVYYLYTNWHPKFYPNTIHSTLAFLSLYQLSMIIPPSVLSLAFPFNCYTLPQRQIIYHQSLQSPPGLSCISKIPLQILRMVDEMTDHSWVQVQMACMRLRATLSMGGTLVMHFWLLAQRATLAAAPGTPRHRVQQVWANVSPHLLTHFLSLSSHPLVALHLAYWSAHLSLRHSQSAADWAKARARTRHRTTKTFI